MTAVSDGNGLLVIKSEHNGETGEWRDRLRPAFLLRVCKRHVVVRVDGSRKHFSRRTGRELITGQAAVMFLPKWRLQETDVARFREEAP